MKLLKYLNFIKKPKVDINSICEKYHIKNYTINEDMSIDVNGRVNLSNLGLTKLPLKFRNVGGDFNCSHNQLTSLDGCPKIVGGYFNCNKNQLTSLEGCPQIIGRDFFCYYNKITDLKGFPEYYEGIFDFAGNPVHEILYLLEYHPKSIYWINEYDVIQGNKIIFQRLEAVAYEFKMDLPNEIKLKNYEII